MPETFAADPFVAEAAAPARFSMSRLRHSQRCLLAMRMDQDHGSPSGEYALFGRLYHEIMATVGFTAVMTGQEHIDAPQALRIARAVLERPEEHQPLSWSHYQDLMGMVESSAPRQHFPTDARAMQVEVDARHTLPGTTRVLSARIDYRLIRETTAVLEDYKTGPGLPSAAAVAGHVQLPLYAWHTWKDYPEVDTFVLVERYVRYGVPRTVVMYAEDLWGFEEYLTTLVARLERAYATQQFPPTPGSWCANCPDATQCPLPRRARPWSIADEAELYLEAQALAAAKAQVKQREDVVQAAMAGLGIASVPVGDQVLVLEARPGRRIDERAARKAGVDLDDYRKPTSPAASLKWRKA